MKNGTATIHTPRLVLRKFRAGDAEAMFRNWTNDPEVTRYMTWAPHGDVNITRKYVADCIKGYEKPLYFHWILEKEGEPIGSLGVFEALGGWEMGYCLSRLHWGEGLMTEAVAGVFHYLFGMKGFRRIFANYSVYNPGSGRVMEKNGMVREGVLRQQMGLQDGRFSDIAIYGILSEEWAVWETGHPMEVRIEQS